MMTISHSPIGVLYYPREMWSGDFKFRRLVQIGEKMTLETLKGIEEIDGFEVCQMDRDWPNYRDKLDRFILVP